MLNGSLIKLELSNSTYPLKLNKPLKVFYTFNDKIFFFIERITHVLNFKLYRKIKSPS